MSNPRDELLNLAMRLRIADYSEGLNLFITKMDAADELERIAALVQQEKSP